MSGWFPVCRAVHRTVADTGMEIVEGWPRSSPRRPPVAGGHPVVGSSGATAQRRFVEWSMAWVWAKQHRLVSDELGSRGEIDWSRCASDWASSREEASGTVGPANARWLGSPDAGASAAATNAEPYLVAPTRIVG
ncbi:transposase [Streptomyces viridochromogenes DSM 40736]|uniref:Transposase n=1 Tax=Streptomyces viridochromogenes (strain DSM 40736 / JCM 4977 / BCRC 1201 / Tue 494) TaxID=591159 RepID=D9X2K3_STRVT|nr:transposase [Streptomyces viridochromogenes DSM 40736]